MSTNVPLATNNAGTTLAAAITTSATTLTVTSGSGAEFPSPSTYQFFPITLVSASNATIFEVAWCTGRSGDTLTVLRGQEGTTALAFNAGDLVELYWTAGAFGRLAIAGFPQFYNSAFATATGGYPRGTVLNATDFGFFWICTTDGTTSNPDTGGSGWQLVNGTAITGLLSGVSMGSLTDCNAAVLGWAEITNTTANAPVSGDFGLILTISSTGSAAPATGNSVAQYAYDVSTRGAPFFRMNVNNGGWSAWNQMATVAGVSASIYAFQLAANTWPLLQTFDDGVTFPTRPFGDSTTYGANTAFVQAELAQVFQTQTICNSGGASPTRAIGTTYTNSTGKPMYVSVVGLSTAINGNLVLNVNSFATSQFGQPNVGGIACVSAIVPNGSTYEVTYNVASFTLTSWVETN